MSTINRLTAPQAYNIERMRLIEPKELCLENGLKIWMFHASDQPLVKAEFVFKNVYDTKENTLLNTALSGLIKEGTSKYSSAEIAENIDYYGSYLIPEFSFDYSALTLYSLNKHIGQCLPLVYDILTDASIPQKELETYIRNNKQALQISLEKNDYLAKQLFYKQIFGESRYGKTASEEGLDAITRDDITNLLLKQIQPANCTLFLSGNITEDVLNEVITLFGTQWKNRSKIVETTAPTFAQHSNELIYQEKSSSVQSAIRLGKQTINRKHEDFPALQFVNTLFGGYFGSRLMQNIREDKGYTYGIGSSIVNLQHSGLMVISTQVGVDVTNATLQEIELEINKLQQDLVQTNEIELVRNYLLGAMLGSLDSIFSHADKFKAVYFSGMDLSYYNYYTSVIKEVDANKIRQIAQDQLSITDLSKIIVGKM